MNSNVLKVVKWAAVVFFAVYVIAQIYSAVVVPVTTDTVFSYSTYTGFDATGFIIRNETVLKDNISGVLSYEVDDGGRVAKGGVVAVAYNSSADADNRVKIEELDRRIATLQKIQTYNDLNAADIASVNRNIHEAIYGVISATQNGKVIKTESYDTLLENMARRQVITGEVTDFNALISSLKSQRDSLKASLNVATAEILSPQSGHVIYTVDGYEDSVSVENLEKLDADTLKDIKKGAVSSSAVCKIVSDYEWYIAVAMPFSEALNLKLGSKVMIKTDLQSVPELEVTVKHINKQSIQGEAVVVFSADTMNNELAQLRYLDITIVYEEHEGLKVDNRAIRFVDGQKGVYVFIASQVKFLPVEVLWQGENYSIVKQEASADKTHLRIYDEVIDKGKNLYDGKFIN
ncbi:MAG: hypothetical protein IIX60_01980 [Clostridia bacterium]|nr:hypothetical protein [Clostridia bacterium]